MTCAALAELGLSPGKIFRQFFYTYGHRNVVCARGDGAGDGRQRGRLRLRCTWRNRATLLADTKVIRRSELLGFPPIACPAADAEKPVVAQLREALLGMAQSQHGRSVLAMLRLDGFSNEPPELFDSIATKMHLVRGLPP